MAEAKNIEALRKTWQHLPAELQHMLEQDMTLEQAAEYHCKVWGFTERFKLMHEASHIIAGLSGIERYQNSRYAEAMSYIVQSNIHKIFSSPLKKGNKPRHFQSQKSDSKRDILFFMPSDVCERILRWLIGSQTKETMQQIKMRHEREAFDNQLRPDQVLENEMQAKGIFLLGHHDKDGYGWEITTRDGQKYNYSSKSNSFLVPIGSNGVENFSMPDLPTHSDIKRVNSCIVACFKYIENALSKANSEKAMKQAFGKIKLRELYTLMPPLQTENLAQIIITSGEKKEQQRG